MKNICFLLFLFSYQLAWSQTTPTSNLIKQAVKSHGEIEKIYIHTDRDYYTGGGDIFFKAYLTDKTLRPQKAQSKVAYVELLTPNQEIVDTKTIELKDGIGKGDFKLTSKYKSGQYVIRAYTNYMRNSDAAFFFRKSIYIRGVTDLHAPPTVAATDLRVQFFPEGGDLVHNLTTKVAIKATEGSGNGIELSGAIFDTNNKSVAKVSTNPQGFGAFTLTAKSNQAYIFKGKYGAKNIEMALPSALSEGVVLSLDNSSEDLITIKTASNLSTSSNEGYLIGHGMGKVFFEKKITNATTTVELPVSAIPYGILQFTFFDNLGQPRAERLVFNHDGIDNFNVDFSTDKTVYNKREKVQLKLDVFDDDGEVIPADLSLSVVDNRLGNAFLNKNNIQSYLLLSSDIKGIIENPTSYFKNNEVATKKALDLLLMTQGWRRFKWQDVLKSPIKEKPFKVEKNLSIAGKITKKDMPDQPIKAVGYLSELSADLSMIPFETDDAGQFTLTNLSASADTDMILQAATLNRKQRKVSKDNYALKGDRNIDIVVEEKIPLALTASDNAFLKARTKKSRINQLTNLERVSYQNDLAYEEGDWSIDIDSVEVTAKKIDEVIEYYESGMLYSRPDSRIRIDEVTNPDAHQDILSVIVGKAPGLEYDVAEGGIVFRGKQTGLSKNINLSNTARYMVNGVLASESSVQAINPTDIAFVDVLRSLNQVTLYGELGRNGLIMIYLKTPEERAKKQVVLKGITNFTFDGYHQAREFYAPNYTAGNTQNNKTDNRVTLHWMPTVQFNDLGEAIIEFYTSDRAGDFDILVEGISADGLQIVGRTQISVK